MEACSKCGGREVVERDGRLHECVCSLIKRIAASMPPYIRKAEILPEHLSLPIVRAVDASVYVVAAWSDRKIPMMDIPASIGLLPIRSTTTMSP